MGSGAANRGDPCGGPPGPGAGAADLERRTGGPQAEARSEGVRSGPPLACYLNFSELRTAEVPRILLLRRLMSNCGRRGRSRNSMLAPNLRPKVVSHGPRLLPRLIVRIGGRLVAGWPWSGSAPPGSSGPAHGPGGHHPGDPGPVAALPQREGLLALRFLSPARVLPEPLLPGPVQPQGTSLRARVARVAAVPRRGTLRSFGRLPRDGHDPHPGYRAGEGIPQGAVLRAGHLRQERLQDRMGLRLQGGPGGRSWGRHHRLRAGRGLLRREAHSRRPCGRRPSRSISGRQRVYGGGVGAALAGGVRGAGGRHPVRQLPAGVAEGRSSLGGRQAPDHRRGGLPTEGLLLCGAPPGEDVGRAAGAPDGQGRSVYLRPASERFARPASSSPGGPVDLTHCTSLVLGRWTPLPNSPTVGRVPARAGTSGTYSSSSAVISSMVIHSLRSASLEASPLEPTPIFG